MYTDPIADYLTRLRNAIMANHRVVEVPASNLKKEITKILKDQGYILKDKGEQCTGHGRVYMILNSPAHTIPLHSPFETHVNLCFTGTDAKNILFLIRNRSKSNVKILSILEIISYFQIFM